MNMIDASNDCSNIQFSIPTIKCNNTLVLKLYVGIYCITTCRSINAEARVNNEKKPCTLQAMEVISSGK